MEIDQADFHITHRLHDDEEPIVHLSTAKNCPNNRDHLSPPNSPLKLRLNGPPAGWDATFSTPKSVSLTALVGGDERVRYAHRESVRVALHELER
ncbi:MAG: relaxase domain-containing protein, partial [Terriglobia bacterium]